LAVVGRSGSGKTTLLNLIGSLDTPTSGYVKFQGKQLNSFSHRDLALFRRQKIGFVFQTFNLLPGLTVTENVESALVHSQLKRVKVTEKVADLLNSLKIADLANRLPFELSEGQQQKVAIARALIKNPALVLADEPTGEMDPIAGKEIVEKLAELNKESKITLVVASHGILSHFSADRTLFLDAGKLVSREQAGY